MNWGLTGAAGRLHRALYTDTSVTYGELFELLEQAAGERGCGCRPGRGAARQSCGFRPGERERFGPRDTREIRDIVARWPMLEQRSGRDDGGTLERSRLRPVRARREAVGVIRRALWPLLDLAAGGGGIPRWGEAATRTALPFRSGIDRRAELKTLLGEEPLFFQAEVRAPGLERYRKAHVYVDVSGSMSEELPLVYGALAPLLDYLHPEIHLFSTEIADVNPRYLRRGETATAWGTDIVCVTQHLLENRVRRALIVTDGWVGEVPGEHRNRLGSRGVRVNSVLTRAGDAAFAAAFKGRVSRLPDLV